MTDEFAKLERVEYEGSRWYRFIGESDPANYFASVTNILSVATHKRLQSWKENVAEETQESVKENAANLGTFLRELIERDLRGEPPVDLKYSPENGEPLDLADFYKRWVKLKEDNQIRAGLTELPVHSKLGFAGTLDIVGKFKGVSVVMDLKSGRYSIKSGWQLAAYKHAFEENASCSGMGMVGLSVPWNQPMKTLIYKHLDFCWNAFEACFTVWKAMYFNELVKMKWRYLKEDEKELPP